MKVIYNKKEMELPSEMTVAQLLKEKGIKRGAVWINGKQLLGSEYETRELQQGDEIKTLRIVAGG